MLRESRAKHHRNDHQADCSYRILFVMIVVVPVVVFMAVIMATTDLPSGMQEIEKAENDHGQPSTQRNHVKGLTQVFADQASRVEIDRNPSPGDRSETGDDLIEGRLVHWVGALLLYTLGEGRGLVAFETFKNWFEKNAQCPDTNKEACSEDKNEFPGKDRAIEK